MIAQVEDSGEEQAKLKVELVRCRSAPGHISKQVESINKQLGYVILIFSEREFNVGT